MPVYTFQVAREPFAYSVGVDAPAPLLEDAVRTWVMRGSGLDAAHVLWAEQTGARILDGEPWASVRLSGLTPVAAFDEVSDSTDLTRDPGSEIELRVNALREMPVRVQFFGPDTVGASTPMELALRTQGALALPSVRTDLMAAGLSPYNNGTVQNVTALLGTKFEGRAVLEMTFYVNRTVSEFTGYIDKVVTRDFMGPPKEGTAGAIDI